MDDSKYAQRGVSAGKEDVYKAIAGLDKGLFTNSFCKVFPDFISDDPQYCSIVHADGAGTKSSLAYLYWKETGDINVWRGIAQDSMVMNTDDLICAGAIDNFLFCSIINRNKNLIPAEVLRAIIDGSNEFIEKMKSHGVRICYMGGETADLGDVIRTITVDSTIACRLPRSRVIQNEIRPGNVIIGFASSGKASYEDVYNSGIGSNGLTLARHDVLDHSYFDLYPETFDQEMKASLVYTGTKNVNDLFENAPLNIGKLLLSPTRTYLPLMKVILEKFFDHVHGAIHCSGGGQTKVLHYINKLLVIKDNLFALPPVFKLIQQESKTAWKEMYRVFNMGHRLELYCDEKAINGIIEIANSYNIEAKIIGRCEASETPQVRIESEHGQFQYNQKE